MTDILWIFAVFAVSHFADGQVYPNGAYQYRPPYPYQYKMTPVYSWYQRDDQPDPEVQTEPNTQDITAFEAQGLLYHNLHRGIHDSPKLQLDHELSLEAARYAKEIAQKLVIKHSPIESRPGQGENIFLRCQAFTRGASAFEAEKEWYATVCNWDFDKGIPMDDKGKPFSRVIWRSAQQMGIGRAIFTPNDQFNCTAVVARYRPYVNMQNYAENVQKGKFVPTGCQYINNVDNADFILQPQPGQACQKISGFKGQMLQEGTTCTIKQLFAIFGASVRRGKQSFSVVL